MNVDRLVQRNPGWKSVTAIDAALADVTRAQISARSTPDIPPLTYSLGTVSLPPLDTAIPGLGDERDRLLKIADRQIVGMRDRLDLARTRQVDRETLAWKSAALAKYYLDRELIESEYLVALQNLLDAKQVEWLNLYLQVQALRRTVRNWSLSIPPSPHLAEAKQELTSKEKQLADLETGRSADVLALRQTRDTRLQEAADERDRTVAEQRAARMAALEKQDEQRVETERAQLMRQLESMIADIRMASAAGVDTGAASAARKSLPPTPVPSEHGTLEAARQALLNQRRQWASYIYQDTLENAAGIAAARHWKLTLTPSPEARNRTDEIGEALSETLWRI